MCVCVCVCVCVCMYKSNMGFSYLLCYLISVFPGFKLHFTGAGEKTHSASFHWFLIVYIARTVTILCVQILLRSRIILTLG